MLGLFKGGYTGFLSQIGTKLRDWAVWQAGAGCYSQAAMSSNDSKTLYTWGTSKCVHSFELRAIDAIITTYVEYVVMLTY